VHPSGNPEVDEIESQEEVSHPENGSLSVICHTVPIMGFAWDYSVITA
jgi:hypothetical protein